MASDPAVRVSVPTVWSEVCGAMLLHLLGPFQQIDEDARPQDDAHLHGDARPQEEARTHMVFYPFRHGAGFVPDEEILAALPEDVALRASVGIERVLVPGGWEEGWKEHFRPITVGRICVRPPWEEPPTGDLLDIVLTPGLAFGTGLHATTRGVLELLQREAPGGPVLDVGTGTGILAIAAGRLGFFPVRALDNDPQAAEVARENTLENGVEAQVKVLDVSQVPAEWVEGATILANLMLEPVLALIDRLAALDVDFRRLIVSGILMGEQEAIVEEAASRAELAVTERVHEAEWAGLVVVPAGR
ncbi:MAG: 50S ribosomal protein L11 methyltransferase [Actinobacteria bacterium]|nr:50S ribosomal protein L11 methyltransferase [Actinomycetota bacterium]